MNTDMNFYYEDFTIQNYERLIKCAKEKYRFILYDEIDFDSTEQTILLRHDVDYSLKGARVLSEIENKNGVRSTYFVYAHSDGYNLYTNDSVSIIRELINRGHSIGLHLDFSYKLFEEHGSFDGRIEQEIELLEDISQSKIKAISFHSPETNGVLDMGEDAICGRINVYSRKIRENFHYCSDSNGYWRYERLGEVLSKGNYSKIQVLLHPVWWTSNRAISPAERVHGYFYAQAQDKWETFVDFTIKSNREVIGIERI